MLAYVFWHQRKESVAHEDYQAKLLEFHRSLRQQPPQGFHGSFVLEAAAGLSWMEQEIEVYEDWYLVENSAILDLLDQHAVTAIRRNPHDQVAHLANNGTGGLYRLRDDFPTSIKPAEICSVTWFHKPVGMSYGKLYEQLHQSNVGLTEAFWQRQMTMGPAPEFCLHSSRQLKLVNEIETTHVVVQSIFQNISIPLG